ncbi:MAG: hypothetical protein JWM98_2704 [Thermoleophilia bacterium]|nr:hypothetical protein [Thermoleophilia bacterium]
MPEVAPAGVRTAVAAFQDGITALDDVSRMVKGQTEIFDMPTVKSLASRLKDSAEFSQEGIGTLLRTGAPEHAQPALNRLLLDTISTTFESGAWAKSYMNNASMLVDDTDAIAARARANFQAAIDLLA